MPDDARLGLGGNNPPTALEELRDHLEVEHLQLVSRRDELLAAVDRVPAEIDDDNTAGKVGDFIKQMQGCVKAAEAARVAAKEPHLAAGRAVDGWFKGIADPLTKAKAGVEKVLSRYLRAKADAERLRREEEERQRREAAERERQAAIAAERTLQDERDLTAAIDAESRAQAAAEELQRASRDAAAKPAEMARTRGDYGSVSTLQQRWTFDPETLDRAELDLETLRPHLPTDGLSRAINSFIRAGGRELPGVLIYQETTARVA